MKDSLQNIYKTARITAGHTQERWAELLGVSAESVRLYETGKYLPSDEIVTRMSEVAVMPVLCYWHLKNKSGVANDLLPDVATVPLPQAVLQLLVEIRNFKEDLDTLLVIAADGYIDNSEKDRFADIVDALDGIIKASWTVKYSEGGPHGQTVKEG